MGMFKWGNNICGCDKEGMRSLLQIFQWHLISLIQYTKQCFRICRLLIKEPFGDHLLLHAPTLQWVFKVRIVIVISHSNGALGPPHPSCSRSITFYALPFSHENESKIALNNEFNRNFLMARFVILYFPHARTFQNNWLGYFPLNTILWLLLEVQPFRFRNIEK